MKTENMDSLHGHSDEHTYMLCYVPYNIQITYTSALFVQSIDMLCVSVSTDIQI